jgi:hypothetical protein
VLWASAARGFIKRNTPMTTAGNQRAMLFEMCPLPDHVRKSRDERRVRKSLVRFEGLLFCK